MSLPISKFNVSITNNIPLTNPSITPLPQEENNPQTSTVNETPTTENKSLLDNTDFQIRIKIADFYCPIRQTVMRKPVSLPCGHNFEEKAIAEWFKKNKNRLCPICKQEIPANTKNPVNLFLKNAIEEWKKTAQVEQEAEENDDVEILQEQESSKKRKDLEEIRERARDIHRISQQGPEGKALAVEMLLALQQEYPNESGIPKCLQRLLQEENPTQHTQLPTGQRQLTSNSSSATPTSLSTPSSSRSAVSSNGATPTNSSLPHPQNNTDSSNPQPINIPTHQSHHSPMMFHSSSGSQQPLPMGGNPQFGPNSGPHLGPMMPMGGNPLFGSHSGPHSGPMMPMGEMNVGPNSGPHLGPMMPMGGNPLFGLNSGPYSGFMMPMGGNSQFGPHSGPHSGPMMPMGVHPSSDSQPSLPMGDIPQFGLPTMEEFGLPTMEGPGPLILGGIENSPLSSDDTSSNLTSIHLKRKRQDDEDLPAKKRAAIELAHSEKMSDIFLLAREGNLAQFRAALNLANVKSVDDKGNTVLQEVVLHGRPVDFIALIMKKGLSVNVQNKEGNTALHIAVQMGITRIIKKLFEYGVDTTILNKAQKTAEQMSNAKNIKRFFAKSQSVDQEDESDELSEGGE